MPRRERGGEVVVLHLADDENWAGGDGRGVERARLRGRRDVGARSRPARHARGPGLLLPARNGHRPNLYRRGASELIRSRLNPVVAHEAMTTGRRYGGEAALAAGIVDASEDADQLLAAAVEFARPLTNKAKPNRAQIKETLYEETLASLRSTPTAG